MRFYQDAFYRHRNTLDVDLQIIRVKHHGPDSIKLVVNFVNRSHTFPFAINQHVTIQAKDLWLWEMVN